MRHTRSSRRAQSGFTLIETMVAIALIGVLGAGLVGVVSVANRIDKANMTSAQNQIVNLMVQEVIAYYARTRTLATITTADMSSVPSKTPWGDTWSTPSQTATSATFHFPMDGADDTLGGDLAAYLSGLANSTITAVSYTPATNILAFTISL